MLRFNFAETKESILEKYLNLDVLLLILTAVAVLGVYFHIRSGLEEEIQRVEKRIEALKAEEKRLKKIKKQERKLLKKKKELKEKLAVVEVLNKNRQVPQPLYFFNFAENPYGIAMKRLAINGPEIEVIGETDNLDNVALFIEEIEKNVGKVKFNQSFRWKKLADQSWQKKPVYRFELKVEQENGSLE